MKGTTVKVGTRGSPLALAQTNQLLARLQDVHPNLKFIVVPIKTSGDRITSTAELRKAGKGLFVKEIERALLSKTVSLAVHSMKDLPSELPQGLVLGAIPERANAADAFIGRTAAPLSQLPPGSAIGTSSLRRQAILKALLPRLTFEEMKGNLDTRLEKLRHPRSKLAGIIVAAAGLQRLYPNDGLGAQMLPIDRVVPAAGQGALALEIRENDEGMRKILAPVHHESTAVCVAAERELQRRLEGGCQVPLGAHAQAFEDGTVRLTAALARLDGTRLVCESLTGMADDPVALAQALETILSSRGAREILDEIRRPEKVGSRR